MPSRSKSKIPPVASRKKRVMHALYLAQPLLQFFALMAVMFVLGRCAPLSSSTDKSVNKANTMNGGGANPRTEHGEGAAQEQDIQRELKDVSRWEELSVMSQTDFRQKVAANGLDADSNADLPRVQGLFAQRTPHRNVRLLIVKLLESQRAELLKANGSLRLDLVDRLKEHMPADVRKAYFGGLHRILPRAGDLSAKAVLVLSDDDMAAPDAVSSLPIALKFQLAIFPNDERAWLQAVRQEQRLDEQQQRLIESTIAKRGAFLALVLE